ncbi:MAG TPA: glycosyltransferase family 2 protein [Candidatus Limnocylindrales bacterium]
MGDRGGAAPRDVSPSPGLSGIRDAPVRRRLCWRGRPATGPQTVHEGITTSVDCVIVAYRSAAFLGPCLDSVAVALGVPPAGTITVVDNASPDASAAVAEAHPARPGVIRIERNLGFGGGCNIGAGGGHGEYLLFLNPDARLEPGTLQALVRELEVDPSLAAVGPSIADPAGAYRAASAGFEPSLRSVLGHFLLLGRVPWLGRWFPPLQLPEGSTERRPDWVSGAAMLVRRSAFEAVAGFDASMFLYMEDVDLCRRLRERGWGVGLVPEVAVSHALGGTQGPEQAETWARAFHAYLARLHGRVYAGSCAALAALGLAARAVAYARSRRALSQRLARATIALAAAALTVPPVASTP